MARLPCLQGRGGGATPLCRHLGRGGRSARPNQLLGRGSGAAPSTCTSGAAADPTAPSSPKDRPMVWPISAGLTDSLPPAWNRKGPYVDEWLSVSESSPSRTSHSTSATTSSSSSLSSSLSVSSPRSRACCFYSIFFLLSSLVFLSHSAAVRFGPSVVEPGYPRRRVSLAGPAIPRSASRGREFK